MIASPIKTNMDFKSRIRLGETPESLHLDFKATVDFSKGWTEPAEAFAIDVAAFANTFGGTLLIGIAEGKSENGQIVAQGHCPLPDADKIVKLLNTTVRDMLSSDAKFETVLLNLPKPIIAVNVFPSISLVGVCLNRDRQAFCFPYRTEYGNRFHSISEIEDRMTNPGSRAMYLKLESYLGTRPQADVILYPKPMVKDVKRIVVRKLRDNSNEFEIVINSRTIQLPFSFIEEIWSPSDGTQMVCIKLRDRIIELEKGGRLDIDHPMDRAENEKHLQMSNYLKAWSGEGPKNFERVLKQVAASRRR